MAGEPLHRVHECAFGVLALESELVDPRRVQRTQPEGALSGPGDTDRTLYSLRRFVRGGFPFLSAWTERHLR